MKQKHDYKNEILRAVSTLGNPSKDHVDRFIDGNRQATYKAIQELIDMDILGYENRQLFFKENDLEKDHKWLVQMLKIYNESVKNALNNIREKRKKSKKPIFYSETIIMLGKPYGTLSKMNPVVRQDIESIIYSVNALIRSSFSLFSKQMLYDLPSDYERMFKEDQRLAVKAITETREKLAKMLSPKNRKEFYDYWYQMTAGLSIKP